MARSFRDYLENLYEDDEDRFDEDDDLDDDFDEENDFDEDDDEDVCESQGSPAIVLGLIKEIQPRLTNAKLSTLKRVLRILDKDDDEE